jgi:eukaryotic-like serine/threonine-protein kinase
LEERVSRQSGEDWNCDPVYVTETIPAGGEHGVSAEECEREGVPTPPHLRVFPELGRGAMGCVHPATDRNLMRHVALKRMDRRLAENAFYRQGFIVEAQITGQLEHPNIVPVYELSKDAREAPYFTMKLVLGESFEQWLADPERPLGSSARIEAGLEILLKACDAIAYAHHRGVVHRDIKPDNIMVASFGQVYVVDWGLARLTRTAPGFERPAEGEATGAAGTLDYMAPEQAQGDPSKMDERTDVFGLGAILYEILSGKCPYGPRLESTVLQQRVLAGAVIPIETAAAHLGLSPQIMAVASRATLPNPDERYQTVVEFRDAILAFLRGGLRLPRQTFAAGTLIIREHDVGDSAFIILSGKCRVSRRAGDHDETLAILGPGEVFGEMALLLDEARVASVEAVTPVTVLVLDKHTMTEGLGSVAWAGALVRALAKRFHDLELKVRSAGIPR